MNAPTQIMHEQRVRAAFVRRLVVAIILTVIVASIVGMGYALSSSNPIANPLFWLALVALVGPASYGTIAALSYADSFLGSLRQQQVAVGRVSIKEAHSSAKQLGSSRHSLIGGPQE